MDETIAIFRLFCRLLQRELTINQIAKETGKSYSFTNKTVRGLIQQGLLQAKSIGHSILCKVNYQHPAARQYLTLGSALEHQQRFTAVPQGKHDHISTILSVLKHDFLCAVLVKDQLFIIRKEEAMLSGDFRIILSLRFKDFIKQHAMEDMIIVAGYEKFWELVGENFE